MSKIVPFVSICTPTFNRRPFIETMFQCFRHQTYPKHRMEWIIVDDGTDKVNDLVAKSGISQIKYFAVSKKMTLGAKRNYMHEKARGSILVYMDDDDYYPPERVSHAVERLTAHPAALCAGSSEIHVFFKHIDKIVQFGPYGPNHATAGTFAFKRELLAQTRYDDHAALAEEKAFLKDYTIPFVQLDPKKSILVFSHNQNTFDKRRLLENPDTRVVKETSLTVDDFIRKMPLESGIKDFFLRQIDSLLEKYAPGDPKMKPDVLQQMKEMESERQKPQQQQQQQQQQQLVMQNSDGTTRNVTIEELVDLYQKQQEQIQQQQALIQQLTEQKGN